MTVVEAARRISQLRALGVKHVIILMWEAPDFGLAHSDPRWAEIAAAADDDDMVNTTTKEEIQEMIDRDYPSEE